MDIVTLALAKKFTKETAKQFGAVKGSNATVPGGEDLGDKTKVTFQWKNDNDEVRQTFIYIPHGKDGIGIKSIVINDNAHLIVTYTDDSVEDAGQIKLENRIGVDLRFTVDVGGVKAGSFFPKNTVTNDEMWQKISTKEEAPAVTLSLVPSTLLYDVVSDQIEEITLSANVTKKTYDVKNLKFYVDDVLVENRDISASGVQNFNFVPESPIKKNTVFKVVVSDGKLSGSASKTVKFVGKTYYGYVEKDVGAPVESQIKALQFNILKDVNSFVYERVTFDFNKIVYAYPKSFGELKSIRDVENNINYFQSFTRTEIEVDGIAYYCYTQNNASKAGGMNITFA